MGKRRRKKDGKLHPLLSLLGVRKSSQRRRVREASRLLRQLSDDSLSDAYRFGIIRNADPFVVEEAILTAYKRAGHRIRRNRRYTGDGDIDGFVRLNRKWHAIQAKRYRSAIRPNHVHDFAAVCSRRRVPGIFFHFGRTGPKSAEAFRVHSNIRRVSGQEALDLFVSAGSKGWPASRRRASRHSSRTGRILLG